MKNNLSFNKDRLFKNNINKSYQIQKNKSNKWKKNLIIKKIKEKEMHQKV